MRELLLETITLLTLLLASLTASPTPLTLTASGPIQTTHDGQVIENLRIMSIGNAGLEITHDNVIVRNVEILHKGGHGIEIHGADNTHIENIHVIHTRAPARGKNTDEYNNIECIDSEGTRITRARLEDGSTGFYARSNCPETHLSFIEGYNFRGPFPRGQFVQFGEDSDRSILEDFYTKNDPAVAWTEDNISIWNAENVTIRRGLIDGNNSPSGIGVIFEHGSGSAEDVDTVNMGNGCFSAADAHDVTFKNVRCRDNICGDLNGRGTSLSNALMFHSYLNEYENNIRYSESSYWGSCNDNIAWDDETMVIKEFTERNYQQRAPLMLSFPWE